MRQREQNIRNRYQRLGASTVRYGFHATIFSFLALLGLASVIGEQSSYITLDTNPTSVAEGEIIYITVNATAHTPVNAVDIVIDYPEYQLEVMGIDTGESVITLWTEEPYAKDGYVYLRGGTFQRGFVGEHQIARIRAKAIESGTAYVAKTSATFIAGDGMGTEVAVGDSEAERISVEVTGTDGKLIGEASVIIVTDVNGDGKVGLDDISAFMSAWFNKSKTFDFNGDGKMTFRDFSILLADSFFR